MRRFVFSILILMSCGVSTVAQELEDDPTTHHKAWKAYFVKVANSYSITPDRKGAKAYEVTPNPIHSYYNSGGGEYNHGTFFFWLENGQPSAIGQLWSYGRTAGGSANVVHEMHSLTGEPFVAKLPGRGTAFWRPRKGGLDFKTLSKTIAAPKTTRGIRLAQMRSIAREFVAIVHRRTGMEELRMQQQPLFRYEPNPNRKHVVDGAVFAFFSSWDPEVILVLEAVKEGDMSYWRYSGVRLCNMPVSLKRADKEVWRVEEAPFRGGQVNGPNDPYFARHGVDRVDPKSLPTETDTN